MLGLAFILLLVTFRSIVVPIKAIVLNLLSVGAAYGVLVLVFQDGHGEKLLDFQSVGGIAPWIPLFLFVILFGLSMDYHVFILSRIREAVDRGMSNDDAVAHGIKSTAGVVTSAALVMVAVFGSFALASDQLAKQIGVGLAAAILIDATIIRAVLLPATHEAARRAQLVPAQAPGLAAEVRARAGGGARGGLILEITRTAAPALVAGAVRSGAFGHALDRGQAGIPLRGEPGHPAGGLVERLGAHAVADLAACAAALDEAGAVEHREVLDDGDAADRQLAGQRRRRALAVLGDQLEHAPAGRVRQRAEDLRAGRAGQAATRSAYSDARPSISCQPPTLSS